MYNKLKVLNLINKVSNWEEVITNEPYNIIIKEDPEFPDLRLLKYNMYSSDFHLDITKECRGLIIDIKEWRPVCWAFNKFANFGESYADEIDWKTAEVQEKFDGSIMKLWFYDKAHKWMLSTNGVIQAKNASFDGLGNNTNFERLFLEACGELSLEAFAYNHKLNKDYTYIFELVSPLTPLVVHYDKTDIYHIGTRDLVSGQELEADIGVKKPKKYALTTLRDCIEAAAALNPDEGAIAHEGFVVVDANYHRIKVKNPDYVLRHRSGTNIKNSTILDLYRINELDDFLAYFPHYKEKAERVIELYEKYKEDLAFEAEWAKWLWKRHNYDRKDIGMLVQQGNLNKNIFSYIDAGFDAERVLEKISSKKILRELDITNK